LLEGLRGKAISEKGILTASGLMSYVYTNVATDKNSHQTPHYGHFDGDGDLILIAPDDILNASPENNEVDSLVSIPFIEEDMRQMNIAEKIKIVKELLSKDTSTIELHDFIVEELKIYLSLSGEDYFKVQEPSFQDELMKRILKYEEISSDLAIMTACIAYWAKGSHMPLLQKIFSRMTDRLIESKTGSIRWLQLRWFPLINVFYYAGISAVENKQYDVLNNIFSMKITSYSDKVVSFAQAMGECLLEFTRQELFKNLPGYEGKRVPMNEYLFKIIQPKLDDILFIGKNYEKSFDEFEVLFALAVVNIRMQNGESVWGPVGRFGWKHFSFNQDSAPLNRIINEGLSQKQNWAPLKAGLFNGDFQQFENVAGKYKELIDKLQWY
jgi:hypothetical protein